MFMIAVTLSHINFLKLLCTSDYLQEQWQGDFGTKLTERYFLQQHLNMMFTKCRVPLSRQIPSPIQNRVSFREYTL